MLMDLIQDRRSIRNYSNRPVDQQILDEILEAARLAPSSRNAQRIRFLLATGNDVTERLVPLCGNQSFVGQAPVFLAIAATEQSQMSCRETAGTVDASIAMSFVLLAAQEKGLGTCWLGSFDDRAVAEFFDLPEGMKVVCATPLGYPAEEPAPRSRKSLEELLIRKS